MTNDAVNGLFEFAGAIFVLNSCRLLCEHKSIRGVSKLSTAFFFAWGLWNLIFYSALAQPFSLAGSIALAAANCYWLALMLKYAKNTV